MKPFRYETGPAAVASALPHRQPSPQPSSSPAAPNLIDLMKLQIEDAGAILVDIGALAAWRYRRRPRRAGFAHRCAGSTNSALAADMRGCGVRYPLLSPSNPSPARRRSSRNKAHDRRKICSSAPAAPISTIRPSPATSACPGRAARRWLASTG